MWGTKWGVYERLISFKTKWVCWEKFWTLILLHWRSFPQHRESSLLYRLMYKVHHFDLLLILMNKSKKMWFHLMMIEQWNAAWTKIDHVQLICCTYLRICKIYVYLTLQSFYLGLCDCVNFSWKPVFIAIIILPPMPVSTDGGSALVRNDTPCLLACVFFLGDANWIEFNETIQQSSGH